MKKIAVIVTALTGSIFLLNSCKKDSGCITGGGGGGRTFTCSTTAPKFAAEVQPIVTSVCATNSNCHASGSTNNGGAFTNHTQISSSKASIKAAILNGSMPKSGSISQAQINAIICWIDAGAIND